MGDPLPRGSSGRRILQRNAKAAFERGAPPKPGRPTRFPQPRFHTTHLPAPLPAPPSSSRFIAAAAPLRPSPSPEDPTGGLRRAPGCPRHSPDGTLRFSYRRLREQTAKTRLTPVPALSGEARSFLSFGAFRRAERHCSGSATGSPARAHMQGPGGRRDRSTEFRDAKGTDRNCGPSGLLRAALRAELTVASLRARKHG